MKTFDERRKSINEYVTKIKVKRHKRIAMVTSICVAVAVLSALLFVPYNTTPPDVSRYSASAYYRVIQQLNLATYQKPKYKNAFQKMVAMIGNFGAKAGAPAPGGWGEAMMNGSANHDYTMEENNGEYKETTDNQVQGVIEGDLLKRSDRYAFYFQNRKICVYSIAGKETALVNTYEITAFADSVFFAEWGYFSHYYDSKASMYLSEDCNTLTVLLTAKSSIAGPITAVVSLDVSDPENITMRNCVYFEGGQYSSRMVDGKLLLTYELSIYKNQMDFDDPSTFVPQYGTPENLTYIPADQIVCPESPDNLRYTVVCMLDSDTLEVMGSTALLGYTNELYVSEDTIYLTYGYNKYVDQFLGYTSTRMTEITGVRYTGDSLEVVGTIALEGSVKDQYSMDAYEGILRVVTSTSFREYHRWGDRDVVTISTNGNKNNANLYCVDLSDWQIKASVIGFAPEGEDAQSVRFDGYHAYVCTAEVITVTDPVYFFDLSDLPNITYSDTGTIDGYSTSLIQLGDGFLLGIGYGKYRTLKVEVYRETENGVISVDSYERDLTFSTEYKSYLIDRENGLIGIPVYYAKGRDAFIEYRLLHFDGTSIDDLMITPIASEMPYKVSLSDMRGFMESGYLYVLGEFDDGIVVVPIA